MLRILCGILLLTACSTVKKGGEKTYAYDSTKEYTLEELKAMAPDIVETSFRDPNEEKLSKLFGPGQPAIKRIGIVVFDAVVQPTLNGIAGLDRVYLTEAGKQLMSERLLRVWDTTFKIVAPDIDYVSTKKIFKHPVVKNYGMDVDDDVKVKRSTLEPDDILFMKSGAKTTQAIVTNPRWMRDVALFLVPATDLMMGPKWSEHNKHYVNDLMKAHNLDAVLIVKSEISWTTARVDKHSGESIPEEMKVKLMASTLLSFPKFQERLHNVKSSAEPKTNLCYRYYEGTLRKPITLSVSSEQENFASIEQTLMTPAFKIYSDLAIMMMDNIRMDLEATHGKN